MDAHFWVELIIAVTSGLFTGATMAGALIYSRGKNTQAVIDELLAIKKQVDANGAATASFDKRSDDRFLENKARFEKGFDTLSREIIQLNEHGGTAVALQIRGLVTQLGDHATRIHALESVLVEIKVISTNVEWIKKTMDEMTRRLDGGNGKHSSQQPKA